MEYLVLVLYISFFVFLAVIHFVGKRIQNADKRELERDKQRRYQSIGKDIRTYQQSRISNDDITVGEVIVASAFLSSGDDGGGSCDE